MSGTLDNKSTLDHASAAGDDSLVGVGADDGESRNAADAHVHEDQTRDQAQDQDSDDGFDDDGFDDDQDDSDDDQDDSDDDQDDSDDGADPRRAAFLDDLPDADELRPLIESYVEGRYARLREQERSLRDQSKDAEILAAARELVERTEPDPLSKILLWLSIGFLLFIIGWVYLHHGH